MHGGRLCPFEARAVNGIGNARAGITTEADRGKLWVPYSGIKSTSNETAFSANSRYLVLLTGLILGPATR
jgi:hypothetical protein